ncbi:hypothetical protein AJ85_12595 [Alkalihalobacillus alcalophilus ATCC 27647 = CGMCC 1.3604]|uniref:Uncharacterized protein n=1 Tax=Alkalihalobacillus alcalophilus ATCC 27647 = CGMCC 1.3604 TaxID=1218173 RepID=A0A4S4JVN9_ALKAL|nr:hypothetical protein AJ85_12595 [Alkalihalobacillus alcalophilus ATCC 27647 = CGMCC 1.3604]
MALLGSKQLLSFLEKDILSVLKSKKREAQGQYQGFLVFVSFLS